MGNMGEERSLQIRMSITIVLLSLACAGFGQSLRLGEKNIITGDSLGSNWD